MTRGDLAVRLIEILAPVIALLITALIALAVAYLQKLTQKVRNEVARNALDAALGEADRAAKGAVLATQQTLVDGLKAAREDGKLTENEAKLALKTAALKFARSISQSSWDVLEASLGPVDEWLEDMLEAKLAEEKKSGGGAVG